MRRMLEGGLVVAIGSDENRRAQAIEAWEFTQERVSIGSDRTRVITTVTAVVSATPTQSAATTMFASVSFPSRSVWSQVSNDSIAGTPMQMTHDRRSEPASHAHDGSVTREIRRDPTPCASQSAAAEYQTRQ